MLNLEQVHTFVVAAETGNFSRAARELHISQPAVSAQIRALEEALGYPLFDRHGRRVVLNEAGKAFLPLARQLIGMAHRVEEQARALGSGVRGPLDVGCSTSAGKYLLPLLLARYRLQYPHVHVRVLVSDRPTALRRLLDGEVHLALTSTRVGHRQLRYRPLFEDPICLIVPPAHPWAHRDRVSPEELPSALWIMREETSGTRARMLEALEAQGITPDQIRVVLELGNPEAIATAVSAGVGVAFVSRMVAERWARLGEVAVVGVEGMQLSRTIYLVENLDLPPSQTQVAFLEFLKTPAARELLEGMEQRLVEV